MAKHSPEATAAGSYRERHTRLVARLAQTDPQQLAFALRTADRFARTDLAGSDLEPGERRELLDVLGGWGVREAVEAFRGGARSTPRLLAHLRRKSNLDELSAVIDGPCPGPLRGG